MSELTIIADVLERFSDVGVVGIMLLVFGLVVTGQLYTKGRVQDIKDGYEARIERLESILDDFYTEQRRESLSRRRVAGRRKASS